MMSHPHFFLQFDGVFTSTYTSTLGWSLAARASAYSGTASSKTFYDLEFIARRLLMPTAKLFICGGWVDFAGTYGLNVPDRSTSLHKRTEIVSKWRLCDRMIM